MAELQKVKAVRDNDGHWYVIPQSKINLFQKLLARNDEQAEEWFINEFSEYMTGGDLNSIQLWAEI